jgi:formylglycine-generating enzyme required for sulfatase activity
MGIVLGAIVLGSAVFFGRLEIIRQTTGSRLVPIPSGIAVIGSDNDPPTDHAISVPAYQIEAHEVSNRQYRACVESGQCSPPVDAASYSSSDAVNMPVGAVTPTQAEAYCHWLGRRLPTATEWERAARGVNGRRWPWGDAPLETLPVLGRLGHVESAEATKTPDGVYELVGNVAEWVSTGTPDVFAEAGGAWDRLPGSVMEMTNSLRSSWDPSTGFRCASTTR